MKTTLTFLITLLISISSLAQNGINYKAIIKDASGNVFASQSVDIRFTINTSGFPIYQEAHSVNTDDNGMIILNIGEGNPIAGSDFSTIIWEQYDINLDVEVDLGDGWVVVGTSTYFKTVPYALHSQSVEGAVSKVDDLEDAKSDSNGSSLFIGKDAGLDDDGTDNSNTGVGFATLYSNTTGTNNTANGNSSLFSNTTGNFNTAYGNNSLYSNTSGHNNTATGADALYSNISGDYNVATGRLALFSNTTGNDNTASGSDALSYNTTGDKNTAHGSLALVTNTTGDGNTAMGFSALSSNTTGYYNVAVGSSALLSNTTGTYNAASGTSALRFNTTGIHNTASGTSALRFNTTGNYNTANGRAALQKNTTGNSNTANGYHALNENTTGINNTANGRSALYNTTGNNNTGIGYDAQVPSTTGSNQVRIGNTDITYAGIQVPWTITSDRRWKEEIRELDHGLGMVMKLKPVEYTRKNNEHKTRELGFIAQDVKLLLEELGYNNHGLLSTADDGYMSLRYNDFIPVLVKAIQEQQDMIQKRDATILNLVERVERLESGNH